MVGAAEGDGTPNEVPEIVVREAWAIVGFADVSNTNRTNRSSGAGVPARLAWCSAREEGELWVPGT